MAYEISTDQFQMFYTESDIDATVLWENHCHSRYEMIAVLEGDVSVMLEGRSYRLTERQTLIISPLCYHTITPNVGGRYRRVTVLFDREAVPEVLRERLARQDVRHMIFSSHRTDELGRICKESDPDFYAPLAEALMVELLYRSTQSVQTETSESEDSFLREVVAYIDEHLCEKILLDDLALRTAHSKSSLCHLFRSKMNVSPKQYILQKKMALAEQLIRNGMPPTAAALRVGYENYSNFYRLYTKLYGANPTAHIREKV